MGATHFETFRYSCCEALDNASCARVPLSLSDNRGGREPALRCRGAEWAGGGGDHGSGGRRGQELETQATLGVFGPARLGTPWKCYAVF